MAFTSGTRLGPHEILSPIGKAGGRTSVGQINVVSTGSKSSSGSSPTDN